MNSLKYKNLYDCHMHTCFSGDCDVTPESQIAAAKNLGLKGLTFTDHLDLDYYNEPHLFDLDFTSYNEKMDSLKKAYDDHSDFHVLKGIELGLQEHLVSQHQQILRENDFDYVIGSIHQIDKEDPYYESFYKNEIGKLIRNANESYTRAFEVTLENLKAFPEVDALGHLDYVGRYIMREFGPEAGGYTYAKYAEEIDAILEFLIQHDIALEINTGAYRSGLSEPNPKWDVIKRYYALGGRLITLGADAHKNEHVGLMFEEVAKQLEAIGFRNYYIYKKRKPVEIAFR